MTNTLYLLIACGVCAANAVLPIRFTAEPPKAVKSQLQCLLPFEPVDAESTTKQCTENQTTGCFTSAVSAFLDMTAAKTETKDLKEIIISGENAFNISIAPVVAAGTTNAPANSIMLNQDGSLAVVDYEVPYKVKTVESSVTHADTVEVIETSGTCTGTLNFCVKILAGSGSERQMISVTTASATANLVLIKDGNGKTVCIIKSGTLGVVESTIGPVVSVDFSSSSPQNVQLSAPLPSGPLTGEARTATTVVGGTGISYNTDTGYLITIVDTYAEAKDITLKTAKAADPVATITVNPIGCGASAVLFNAAALVALVLAQQF